MWTLLVILGSLALGFFAVALVALGFGLAVLRQHGMRLAAAEQRLAATEARITGLEAVRPHTRLARDRQDVGEAFLFQVAQLLEDQVVIDERLRQIQDLAEHVRAGGKPDDLRSARVKK